MGQADCCLSSGRTGPVGLLAAYELAGEPLPPMAVAHGLGLGFDPPVISRQSPATAEREHLDPGMGWH